jgi:flavin reductase (DIM6/NTAB) family NADH-FMN oxidoreductase RutF
MNALEPRREIDSALFRRVMGSFATGVTVILAEANGAFRGMTANAFMSGSLEPPLCVVSVAKRAHMHAHLSAAGRFSINILAAGQEDCATHFAGRPLSGFEPPLERHGGVPVLAATAAVAVIVADTAATHDCGDHTIFVGHVMSMNANDRPPLLYHGSRFASLVTLREESPSVPEFW